MIALLWIMIFSSTTWAICREGEIRDSSSNKVFPSEIADHVGFCSHHASRDLLFQELCRSAKEPADCFQPAVVDFLDVDANISAQPLGNKARNSYFAMEEIVKRGTVASEECLGMKKLFGNPIKKNYSDYGEKFVNATRAVAKSECLGQNKSLEACAKEMNSPQFNEFIYSAVKKWKEEKGCSQRPIPTLKISQIPIRADGKQPSENLNQILRSGRQVKAITSDPHAVVVSNFRTICRKGKETLQYQLLDSLYGTQWSTLKKPGEWIDGEAFVKSLMPNEVFTSVEAVRPTETRALGKPEDATVGPGYK